MTAHDSTAPDRPVDAGRQGSPLAPSTLWICLSLAGVILALYSHVTNFEFVLYDDGEYVSNNPQLKAGLSPQGIEWAFTSMDGANWFPLTRLSYLIDYTLFDLRPGGYHVTNVFLHACASILLFIFLLRATKLLRATNLLRANNAFWPVAFVAFLFALHPLHVESVAWIAERKDVLCAVFWFLTLWSWTRYIEKPSPLRYLLTLLLFALGLMSKPMVVTLPFLLLLLDVWPFERPFSPRLLSEKLPFFALSAADSFITWVAQRHYGAVQSLERFPLTIRIENALIQGVVYAFKMFWPSRLAADYPYPKQIPAWQAVAAGLLLLSISALVLRSFKGRPYLAVGWFWYLGTLVPVIGIVQVGANPHADRYMYVPMVGLAIMLAFGGRDLVRHWPRSRRWMEALATAALLALVPVAWAQINYWQNSETLFRRAIAVTTDNHRAYLNLGAWLALTDRLPEAIAIFEAGLGIDPNDAKLQNALGGALLNTNVPANETLALEHFRAALRITPNYPTPLVNIATVLFMRGQVAEAIGYYRAALRIDPRQPVAHYRLGNALAELPGHTGEAIAHYREALRIRPDFADAQEALRLAVARQRLEP